MLLRVTPRSITKHVTICCVYRPSSRSNLISKLKCGLCKQNFSMLLTLKRKEKSDRRHPHQNITFHSVCVLVWLQVSSFGRREQWRFTPNKFLFPPFCFEEQEACWIRINKNYRSICIFVNRITQKIYTPRKERVKLFHPQSRGKKNSTLQTSSLRQMCKMLVVLRMRLEFLIRNASMYKARLSACEGWMGKINISLVEIRWLESEPTSDFFMQHCSFLC